MFFNRKLRKSLSKVSFRIYDHVYRNFDDYFRLKIDGNGYFLEWLNPEFGEVTLINRHFRNLRTPTNTRLTLCTHNGSVKEFVDYFTEYAERFVKTNIEALKALDNASYLRKYNTLWYENDTIFVHLTPYDVEEYIEMVRASTLEEMTDKYIEKSDQYIEKYKEAILRRMAESDGILDADHPEIDFIQYERWLEHYKQEEAVEAKNEECKETLESIRKYKV